MTRTTRNFRPPVLRNRPLDMSPGVQAARWSGMDLRNQARWYRLEAVRCAGRTTLCSGRQNILKQQKFHYIATALEDLPDDTCYWN
jgi:hypothetical protein